MAVSSNGSPSPSPVLSRSNPNPGNSEISNTVRRSVSGNPLAKPSIVAKPRGFNPVTPANSPSDFLRRPSNGKECVVPAHQNDKENENEKDQIVKPARTRSPAATKNFMSPTISAASKIAASPQKKVLLERNDLVRTSLSALPEGKSPCSSVNLPKAVEDEKPASSDSTVVDPASPKKKASPSPSTAYEGNEVLDFQLPSKSRNDSESLSEVISMESDCAGIDVCSKTRHTPSSASIRAPPDSDPSLPPYDPKTNYLSPRPQFLHYKPNPRIQKLRSTTQDVGSRESKKLEDRFTSEILSDTETNEESESEDSSSVELIEGENERVEESEAALAEPAQEPNVAEPNPIDISTSKRVLSSYSFFRWKPIALLLLLLVGCFWIGTNDSPFISSLVSKESSFTKLYKLAEVAEVAEFARTNLDGLTRNLRLWSANTVSYFSKMIPIVKESTEFSFNQYGNFTDCSYCDMKKNQQNFQWPVKEPESNRIKAYEKGEEASQINPKFEEGSVTLQAEVVEPDDAELEWKPEEYHVHTEPELGSQSNPESEEANLSLQVVVLECRNSEGRHMEEGSSVDFPIDHEAQNIIAEKEQEAQVSLTSAIEPELLEAEKLQGENDREFHVRTEPERGSQRNPESEEANLSLQAVVLESHKSEGQHIEEESSVSFHKDHEVQNIIDEKEQEAQVPVTSEFEPELLEADKLQGENDQESRFAFQIDHGSQAIENEKEVKVVQVPENDPDVPEDEEGYDEIELTSDAEVEPAGAAVEPKSSELKASTANLQSFQEPCLSLKEKSSPVGILGISLLISILTVAAAFLIFAKQQKSPTPSAAAISMDHLVARKLASIPTTNEENTHQERLSSRNWPTEVDMAGVSCPSEVSSLRSISPHSKTGAKGMGFISEYSMNSVSLITKGLKGVSEAQSQGTGRRKSSNRRESLASSSEYSTGSTSYGSFTSYEKIPSKHGGGDEEVVTPVRRSSRIRNQITSP